MTCDLNKVVFPETIGFRDENESMDTAPVLMGKDELASCLADIDGGVDDDPETGYDASQEKVESEDVEVIMLASSPDQVMEYIEAFFDGREAPYGGPIPLGELVTERNIEVVYRLQFEDCIDVFYDLLKVNEYSNEEFDRDTDEDDEMQVLEDKDLPPSHVELLLRLQTEAAKRYIPRPHVGGLMLLYLRHCMGYALFEDEIDTSALQ